MTPEKHAQATALAQASASLARELKAWEAMTEPPQILGLHGAPLVLCAPAGIPPSAWSGFRAACMAHVQAAIDKNASAFAAL